MSAIREWFGYYNAIFSYMEKQFGEKELGRYFDYLVNDANQAAVTAFQNGGLTAIRDHYVENFRKDGDESSAEAVLADHELELTIRCPGYYYAVPTESEERKPGHMLCKGCRMLNERILQKAGYSLAVSEDGCGNCRWTITEKV